MRFALLVPFLLAALAFAGCCSATEEPRAVYNSPCAEAAPASSTVTYSGAAAGVRAFAVIPGNIVGCLTHTVEGVGRTLSCVGESLIPKVEVPPSRVVVEAGCVEAAPAACAESVVEEPYTVRVPVQTFREETRVRRYRVRTYSVKEAMPECAPPQAAPTSDCACGS